MLRSRRPLALKLEASGLSPTLHIFLFQLNVFFIVHHYGTNSEPQLNAVYIDKDGAFQLKIKSQCCLILLHLSSVSWCHTTIPYCLLY